MFRGIFASLFVGVSPYFARSLISDTIVLLLILLFHAGLPSDTSYKFGFLSAAQKFCL